jgi:CBS domain-containing protein
MQVKDIMSVDIHYIQVPGNRSNAMKLMSDKKVSGLPIVKRNTKKLVGMLTRTDLVKNPDEEQIALIMTRNIITAHPEDSLQTITEKMLENGIRRIPIVENDELVGLVTASDIINNALWKTDIQEPVENYMIRNIPTTWERTPLNIAFEIMRYYNLKVLLSLNKDGKLSGILTETDFIEESEIISERTVHNTSVGTVKDVATSDLSIVTTKTSVKECANKMRQRNIEQIPIIDVEGDLVGLIRATDLIKAIKD